MNTLLDAWVMLHKEGVEVGLLTYGQTLGPAMKMTETDEAKEYLNQLVYYQLHAPNIEDRDLDTIWKNVMSNLGYYSGYYGPEVAPRVRKLFGAVHPIMPWLSQEIDNETK